MNEAIPDAPADSGMLVIVVGSSGAGKDSLLAMARAAFRQRDDIVFVRRVITRAADDSHEPHDSVDEATFEQLRQAGEFVVHWDAHALRYGVPRHYQNDLCNGRVVVLNGSREALPRFAACFPRRRIVHVTVPADLLERRLRERGREDEDALARRLARKMDPAWFDGPVWTLDNSGTLKDSSDRLNEWLSALSIEIRTRAVK